MTPETARADGETGPRLPVRSSRLQTLLLVGVAVIGLAAAGIAVCYRLTQKPEEITPDPSTNFPARNFAFVEPSGAWSQDGEMLGLVASPFLRVYRRDNPEAFIAVGARDYVDRAPRPGELRDPLEDRESARAAANIEAAVVQVVNTKIQSLAAGKMGHSTSQVGDLVAEAL
jgi:hypothetical protein